MIVYPKFILRYEFEITEVGGETAAVCVDDAPDAFHGIIRLKNDTAVFMFEKLKEGISVPVLIMECMRRYSEPVEQVGPVVMDFLTLLGNKGLIIPDKKADIPPAESNIDL